MKEWLLEIYEGMTHERGIFSHTKTWSAIANLTATFIIIKLTYINQLTEEYFLIYMSVVASHAALSKFLNNKTINTENKTKKETND